MKPAVRWILVISLLVASAAAIGFYSCSPLVHGQVWIVRHAEKVTDGSKDPALTPEGQERAEALARMLRSVKFQAIFSSDTLRTRSTAKPLAEQQGLDISIYDPRESDELASLLKKEYKTRNVLIVGHSNTVPELVRAFRPFDTQGGRAKVPDMSEEEYDRIYVVRWDGSNVPALTTLHYPD